MLWDGQLRGRKPCDPIKTHNCTSLESLKTLILGEPVEHCKNRPNVLGCLLLSVKCQSLWHCLSRLQRCVASFANFFEFVYFSHHVGFEFLMTPVIMFSKVTLTCKAFRIVNYSSCCRLFPLFCNLVLYGYFSVMLFILRLVGFPRTNHLS